MLVWASRHAILDHMAPALFAQLSHTGRAARFSSPERAVMPGAAGALYRHGSIAPSSGRVGSGLVPRPLPCHFPGAQREEDRLHHAHSAPHAHRQPAAETRISTGAPGAASSWARLPLQSGHATPLHTLSAAGCCAAASSLTASTSGRAMHAPATPAPFFSCPAARRCATLQSRPPANPFHLSHRRHQAGDDVRPQVAAAAAAGAPLASAAYSTAASQPDDPPPASAPAPDGELHTVDTAIWVNSAIFVAKCVAWSFSGSASMLAEAVHSAVDVGNQVRKLPVVTACYWPAVLSAAACSAALVGACS